MRACDLGLADPPVVIGFSSGRPWRPFLSCFSLAAVEIVLSESVNGGPEGRLDNRQLDDADITMLEEQYERLPFPDYPAWWQPDVPQALRWFTGPGVLLSEESRTWLWVLAQNEASLAQLRDTLPGDWPSGFCPALFS